jgi:hypothetical protein
MTLQVRYPWATLNRGEGFFVPSLDVEKTKAEGLGKALGFHLFDARATIGIRAGLMGVWFFRLGLLPV